MKNNSISKTHQLYDESTDVWYDVYTAPGVEGQLITAEVPREERQVASVRRHLLSKGAQASAVEDEESLKSAIASDAPVVRRAARTGWRDNNTVFVSHRHVAGVTGDQTLLPPMCPQVGAAGQLEIRGELSGWQEVILMARYSTAMILALCAVFTAPLLAPLHLPSFALVLVGRSRSGKSAAQLVAASAMGFGKEEELPSLNATPAGLLATASASNDLMLPVNEIGTARGPKDRLYIALRDVTYALMNGRDVDRHPSWTGSGSGTPGSFQVLPLFSSEHSPDVWAARNGESRDEGETARLIGVPVVQPGHTTVFDRVPKSVEEKDLPKWTKRKFRKLRRRLPKQRGVALRTYLDQLVSNRIAYTRRARLLVTHFEEVEARPDMSAVQRDIVTKFAALFAGGNIAIHMKILPLPKSLLGRALQRACRAALAALPDPQAELREDRQRLRAKLESGGIVDLESCSGRQVRMLRNADGFTRPRQPGHEYIIRADLFATWFVIPLRTRCLLEWLDAEGLLDHTKAQNLKLRSNGWAQKQVTWPDGTRQRSIVIYLPNGLADLANDDECGLAA